VKAMVTHLYASYGRYADEMRAIPNAIDGLKIIERRLLLTLHETARTSKTVKSAKVIGHLIGTYHPHGDCLEGSTEIFGLDGITYKLEDLVNDESITSLEVLSYDSKNNKIVPATATHFRKGKLTNKIYNIKLSNGETIRCSKDHKFYIHNKGWFKAEDLKINDIFESAYIRTVKNKEYKYPVIRPVSGSETTLAHDVYDHYNSDRCLIHHKNQNTFNNIRMNLENTSRGFHAIEHSENYEKGLENGRIEMFSDGGRFRNAIKKKNTILVNEINKIGSALLYVLKILKTMESEGLQLTETNYNKERKYYYNAPYIDRLIKNKKIQCFDDLLSLKATLKIDSSKAKGFTKGILRANDLKNTANTKPQNIQIPA